VRFTTIPPSQIRGVETIEELVVKNQSVVEETVSKAIKEEKKPWTMKDGLIHWETQIYIPDQPQLREKVIQQSHDHPTAGHPGIKKTKDLVKQWYYWPTMNKDVEKYVEGCDICQKVKTKPKRTPLHPNEIPNAPWEIISINIIGPLPESQGKDAILTVVDMFSKMIHLFAVSTTITAQGVAKIYRDHIFKLHGTPRKIVSDRGPQFISSFMKGFNELLQIQGNPSTAYHPQTDG
jgi:hypothetical protein